MVAEVERRDSIRYSIMKKTIDSCYSFYLLLELPKLTKMPNVNAKKCNFLFAPCSILRIMKVCFAQYCKFTKLVNCIILHVDYIL